MTLTPEQQRGARRLAHHIMTRALPDSIPVDQVPPDMGDTECIFTGETDQWYVIFHSVADADSRGQWAFLESCRRGGGSGSAACSARRARRWAGCT